MIDQLNDSFKQRMLNQSSDSSKMKHTAKETIHERKGNYSFEKEKIKDIKDERVSNRENVETMTEEEQINQEEEELKEINSSEELREKIKKRELEEARAFLRELVEEEPVEGILKPEDSENEKPQKKVVEQEIKKPKVVKEKPKVIQEKKEIKVIKKKDETEISPEEQERRDLAQLLIEINEGQESGVLELSSSGRNSRAQSSNKEKDKKINKKVKNQEKIEKDVKPKIEKNTKITQIKKTEDNQKVENLTKEQLEIQEKQEVRELFRQFEEMQEEGLLKPNDNKVEENTAKKVETPKKERPKTPKKEPKKPTQPTTPIKPGVTQEVPKEFNEKEEVRELFRQLEQQEEEGLLRETSVFHPQKEVSQNNDKKEKVVKKKQEKPKEKVVKTTTQVQQVQQNDEPQLSPEELEKKELRDLFHELELEQEEGLLRLSSDRITSREPSVLSKKSIKSIKSVQSAQSTTTYKSSQKSEKVDQSRTPSKVPYSSIAPPIQTAEEIAEQEKRDLVELFKQLEEDEEEGLLRLPDEKNLSQFSTNSKKSTPSKQKTTSKQSTLSAQKERTVSRQSNVSSPKDRSSSRQSILSKQNRAKH